MAKSMTTRADDYAQWYNDLVLKSGLAEYSAVRGCMNIKPYGFAIWEGMKEVLDRRFKETGHVNASFPLLIPKSFFSKEADHVEGFAKECAVVTHYRLKNDPDGGIVVDPDAKLEEEMIIRPTSETLMWNAYKGWIQSYRDLPLLINQWANVMRWEMRTRLFLRTAEFHWQEGHTAHATSEEAMAEARKMLDVYAEFMEGTMAVPVIRGVKTETERFAGAVETFTVEGLMQDGKALQMGTSHFLGQNFAKAFDVTFLDKEGKRDLVWGTSWGVSTRMMGALIMVHSDDEGLVLPPKLAPTQVVLVPIMKGKDSAGPLLDKLNAIAVALRAKGLRVKVDDDDTKRPGWKFAEYELRGVPVRLAMGGRDLENGTIELARRDLRTKETVPADGIADTVASLMDTIQDDLFQKALDFRNANIHRVDEWADFEAALDKGGFVLAHWDGTAKTENDIKNKTKATIRCLPLEGQGFDTEEEGQCILTGQRSTRRVLFARAY
jgi:prolyl-tRNA synthetase